MDKLAEEGVSSSFTENLSNVARSAVALLAHHVPQPEDQDVECEDEEAWDVFEE